MSRLLGQAARLCTGAMTLVGLALGALQMLDAVIDYVNHDPHAVLEVSSQAHDKAIDAPSHRR